MKIAVSEDGLHQHRYQEEVEEEDHPYPSVASLSHLYDRAYSHHSQHVETEMDHRPGGLKEMLHPPGDLGTVRRPCQNKDGSVTIGKTSSDGLIETIKDALHKNRATVRVENVHGRLHVSRIKRLAELLPIPVILIQARSILIAWHTWIDLLPIDHDVLHPLVVSRHLRVVSRQHHIALPLAANSHQIVAHLVLTERVNGRHHHTVELTHHPIAHQNVKNVRIVKRLVSATVAHHLGNVATTTQVVPEIRLVMSSRHRLGQENKFLHRVSRMAMQRLHLPALVNDLILVTHRAIVTTASTLVTVHETCRYVMCLVMIQGIY
jgi:hypothetical protein